MFCVVHWMPLKGVESIYTCACRGWPLPIPPPRYHPTSSLTFAMCVCKCACIVQFILTAHAFGPWKPLLMPQTRRANFVAFLCQPPGIEPPSSSIYPCTKVPAVRSFLICVCRYVCAGVLLPFFALDDITR